jgi:hypothetical protein
MLMLRFFSVVTCSDQVESINIWISGICKDYPGIIPLGAMHPDHKDPEAEIQWMWQPGIKVIKLHDQRARISVRSVRSIRWMLGIYIISELWTVS